MDDTPPKGLEALEAMDRLSGGQRSQVIAFLISVAKSHPSVKGKPQKWATRAQHVAHGWAYNAREPAQREIGEFYLGAVAYYPEHVLEVCRGLCDWWEESPAVFTKQKKEKGTKGGR